METYKKKSLRFSGFAKEIRTQELNSLRQSARDTRFSFLRPITDEEDDLKENHDSKIPVPGKKTQLPRAEMLKKFKEEKLLKKQKELQIKKPEFKCGLPVPKSLLTSSRLGNLSRMQESFQSFSQKSLLIGTSIKGLIKPLKFSKAVPKGIKNKDSNSSVCSQKPQTTAVIKPQIIKNKVDSNLSSGYKPQAIGISKLQTVKNKVNSALTSTLKPVTVKPEAKENKSKGIIPTSNIKSLIGKPQSSENKNKSFLPPRNLKPLTGKPEAKDKSKDSNSSSCSKKLQTIAVIKPQIIKNKVDSNSSLCSQKPQTTAVIKPQIIKNKVVPKPATGAITRLLSKKVEKVPVPTVPKPHSSNKSKQTTDQTSKATGTTSKPVQFKPKSTINLRNPTEKPKTTDKKLPQKIPVNTSTSSTKDVTFSCQLSIIEPIQTEERSFAPKGFLFCPPAELHSSYFMDEGPTAIFSRLKCEANRTSTPKQKSDSNDEKKSSNDESSFLLHTSLIDTTDTKPALETKANLPAVSLKSAESLEIITSENKQEENAKLILQPVPEDQAVEKEPFHIVIKHSNGLHGMVSLERRQCKPLTQQIEKSLSPEKHSLKEYPKTFQEIVPSEVDSKSVFAVCSPESKLKLPSEMETSIPLKSTSIEDLKRLNEIEAQHLNVTPEPASLNVNFDSASAVTGSSEKLSLVKDAPKNSDIGVVHSEIPENCLLASKPSKLAAPEMSSQPEDIVHSTIDTLALEVPKVKFLPSGSLPKQTQNSSEVCTSDRLEKIPILPSPSFLQVTPLESLPSTRIKTRSYYRQSRKLSPESTTKSTGKKSTILETTPKSHRRTLVQKEFTPRRSARLASKKEFDSEEENILDEQPSFFNTPEDEEPASVASGLTCVFERLHLDSPVATTPSRMTTRACAKDDRLSLLYTPPHKGRRATIKKSIVTEDLMSFSPIT